MATVPRFSGPTVEPTVVRGGEQRAHDFGQDALTRGVQNLAGAASQIAMAEVQKNDEAQLVEFENKLGLSRQRFLAAPEGGALRRQGKDAIGSTKALMPQWERDGASLLDALPPRLRRVGQQILGRNTEAVRTSLMSHEVQQADQFHAQEMRTGIELADLDALAARGNPQQVDAAVDRAAQYRRLALQRAGASEDTVQLEQRKLASSIYRRTIEALADDDPDVAEQRLTLQRGLLTSEDQIAIEGLLRPAQQVRDGRAIGESMLAGVIPDTAGANFEGPLTQVKPSTQLAMLPVQQRRALPYNAPELDAYAASVEQKYGLPAGLLNAVKNAGERSNSGQVSPKGARGVMQFMPENLRKYGVADATDPAEIIDAAGRYLRDGLARYGNVEAAIADYNGGPRAAKAVLDGRAAPAKETRDYLARVSQALGGQPRAGARPVVGGSAEELIAAIPANLPSAVRREAENVIRDRFAARQAAEDRRRQEVGAAIYDKVTRGEQLSRTEIAAMARDPSVSEAISRYRNALAAGRVIEDDPVAIDEIYRLRFSDPTKFASLNLAQYADRLSGKTLVQLRDDQAKVGKTDRPDWSNEEQRLNEAFYGLGIAPSGDTKGGNQVRERHRGEFRMAWNAAVAAYTQDNGKKPVGVAADTLLRTVQRNYALRMADQTARFEKKLRGAEPGFYERAARQRAQFDPAQRAQIRALYREKHGREPSETYLDNFQSRARE